MPIIRKKGVPIPVAGAGASSTPSADWVDAPTDTTRRVAHVAIVGETGTGKTTLALTGPGPIALVNADEKLEGVVQPVAAMKQVKMLSYGFVAGDNIEDTAARAGALWQKIRSAVLGTPAWAHTCIIDSETETWELARLGEFGTLKPSGRTDNLYGRINAEYRTMFKSFRLQDRCHIVTTHGVKDEYIDKMKDGKVTSVRTGRLLRAGFKEMATIADIVLRMGKRITDSGVEFYAVIEKGWYNAQTEGLEISGADLNLPYIFELITGVPAEEWK